MRIGNIITKYQAHIDWKDGTSETITLMNGIDFRDVSKITENHKIAMQDSEGDWHVINLNEIKKILFSKI